MMNKIYALIAFLMLCVCAPSVISAQQQRTPKYDNIDDWLKFGKKHLRRAYRAGATGPYAFDCSGFTMYMYKELGIDLPHNSDAQSAYGEKVSPKKAKPGDLVFYCGSKGKKIGHVGIVYEKKNGEKFTFIHASTSQGIVIDNSDLEYYRTRFKEIRRLTTDDELYALKHGKKRTKKEEETMKEEVKKEEKPNEEVIRKQETEKEKTVEEKGEKEQEVKKDVREETKKKKSRRERKKEAEERKRAEREAKKDVKKEEARTRKTHIVAQGETLYRISKAYGVSVEDIQRWNGINGTGIGVGQSLYVEE